MEQSDQYSFSVIISELVRIIRDVLNTTPGTNKQQSVSQQKKKTALGNPPPIVQFCAPS